LIQISKKLENGINALGLLPKTEQSSPVMKSEEEKLFLGSSIQNSPNEEIKIPSMKNVSNFSLNTIIVNEPGGSIQNNDKILTINPKNFIKDGLNTNLKTNLYSKNNFNYFVPDSINLHPKFAHISSNRNSVSISIVSKNHSMLNLDDNANSNLNNFNLNLILDSSSQSKNNLKSEKNLIISNINTNLNNSDNDLFITKEVGEKSEKSEKIEKIEKSENFAKSEKLLNLALNNSVIEEYSRRASKLNPSQNSRNNKSLKILSTNQSNNTLSTSRRGKLENSKMSSKNEKENLRSLPPSQTDLYKVSPILQINHPKLHQLFNEFSKDKYNRRNAFVLNDKSEIKMFISKILESFTENSHLNDSYIPKQNHEIINHNSPLNKIYSKCDKEIKVASEVDKLLSKQMKKVISNSFKDNEKIKKKQDEFLYSRNEKEKENLVNFNYDKKTKNKMDIIPKLSEKLAFLDRQFFIKNFGYDYNKDSEFIFQEELVKKQLEEEKLVADGRKNKVKGSHHKVQDILERSIKDREALILKVNTDIEKKKFYKQNFKNKSYNFDENYPLDFLSVPRKEKSKYLYMDKVEKSPTLKPKTNFIKDDRIILPKIQQMNRNNSMNW
jgi:hypothetical protein